MSTASEIKKDNQIILIFAIIKLLIAKRNPVSLVEIEEELQQMSYELPGHRQMQRNMNLIEELGYTISLGKGKGYFLQNREEMVGTFFADDEVQALQMGRAMFRYFEGTKLKESIDSAISMVTGSCRSDISSAYLDELEDAFMVHLGPHRELGSKSDLIDELASAINQKLAVEISYHKPNSANTTFVVEPYRIVLYRDTLYLLAQKQGEPASLRVYHISRIDSATMLDREFVRSRKLLDAYEEQLSNSFGIFAYGTLTDVTLRFDKSVSDAIHERVWHHSQVITESEDSVTMNLKVLDSNELIAWILGWGKVVKEILPVNLAERVKEMRG